MTTDRITAQLQQFEELIRLDTPFAQLMNKRIYNILLVATKYDAFMLEDDGRVDEQIFNEYVSLNLSYPPRFTQVSTAEEAFNVLSTRSFELIICMPNMYDKDAFASAKLIKTVYAHIPVVVLTPFSHEVSRRMAQEDLGQIDYVFSWLGDASLLLAIIKLIEDEMNIADDTASVGVQVIMVVEDSVRFYSSVLTHLYKFILEQSKMFAQEALNPQLQKLRMRGRPKIKLARTYEEAVGFFDQYRQHILGVITDMSYQREGVKDEFAGYHLGQYLLNSGEIVPLIIDSSDAENKAKAKALGASFLDKNSKTFPQDLRKKIMRRLGFGDFVIIDPDDNSEVMRITDLPDLQRKLNSIPDKSLLFHLKRNHFSRFLFSRAIFPLANILRQINVDDHPTLDEARRFIHGIIDQYRRSRHAGVVATYQKDKFDAYTNFARIGEGSLGGKGRGLAFMGTMVKRHKSLSTPTFKVNIPKTTVICTDIFDAFMEDNNLYPIALSDASDEEILRAFVEAHLPDALIEDLAGLIHVMQGPLAVRSSSLLEDAHYQPFAGVYSTYMVPPCATPEETLLRVKKAIKGVYASVFFADSKTYMTVTSNIIDQEKMAVVIQEVVGSNHEGLHYPAMSGVARSLNFYPINDEAVSDGVANVALGLGKHIVDGGVTLRFSPRHPNKILQLSSTDFALRDTQTKFLALDLTDDFEDISTIDAFNLKQLTLREAEAHGVLKHVASTYDAQNMTVWDGYYKHGRKIISFVHILQHGTFPLAETIDQLLAIGAHEMGKPVEIEFAMDLDWASGGKQAQFYLLQIRPIVHTGDDEVEDLRKADATNALISSPQALGHGVNTSCQDVVYVKLTDYDQANNPAIAQEIARINQSLLEQDRPYVLIGPGRWGSSDHWLGIPVNWPQISQARCIVECSTDKYQVDPSQGTHFFQNLTSFGVSYLTIAPFRGSGTWDEAYLNALPAEEETDFVRHVRLSEPLTIKVDGPHHIGLVLKPQA